MVQVSTPEHIVATERRLWGELDIPPGSSGLRPLFGLKLPGSDSWELLYIKGVLALYSTYLHVAKTCAERPPRVHGLLEI